jgi:hypothetical protein
MAGPFARLRRGEAEAASDDQPTEMLQAVTADSGPTADAPTTEAPKVDAPAAGEAPAAEAASAGEAPAAEAAAAGEAPAAEAPSAGEAPAAQAAAATETPATETHSVAEAPAAEEQVPADTVPGEETPGWIERGKLRRRLRFVRRARELALRDLGGLVFDLHRFGRERNDLVEQKLSALSTLDSEMRALETLLEDQPEITVLNEPGLASCPRCGALHASDAAYCSACGLPVGNRADLPSGPALAGPVPATPAPAEPEPPVHPALEPPS